MKWARQRAKEKKMSKKLYVGGLAWEVTSEDLNALFSAHGPVDDAVVITDRESGRSRGFGFVTMGSAEAAQSATAALNGSEQNGRTIRVDPAQDKPRNSSRNGGGGGGGRGRPSNRW